MEIISLKNVHKSYGKLHALFNVSLGINKGEWVSVMGPSGSGKSTLLNALGGLDAIDSGALRVDGVDISSLREEDLARFRREKIGFVFQQFHMVPYLTALENVMVAQYYHSMIDEAEALQALKYVGLETRATHLPSQLSGGEQQRVCIARALINRPNIILADEPTGNLDEENEKTVLALLAELKRQGHTIVMVTHDVSVGGLADRQIQLEHGKIVGTYLTDSQGEEAFDHMLEHIWTLREKNQCSLKQVESLPIMQRQAVIEHLQTHGFVLITGDSLALTEKGELRARDVVRRQRLAEVLFSKTFRLEDHEVEQEACHFEHQLSPRMTDNICSYLGHPKICPHGNSIPAGTCCV